MTTNRWGDDFRADLMAAKELIAEAQDTLDWIADDDRRLPLDDESAFLRLVERASDSLDKMDAAWELESTEDRPDDPGETDE